MGRLIIIACLIAASVAFCLAIDPAQKPNQHANESKTASDKEREPSLVVVNNENSDNVKRNDTQEAPKWYRTVNWSNWVLVIVAFFTGLAVLKQAVETAKAAQATREAAEAARKSAEAAKLNAQAVINCERPWIVVTVKPNPACEGTFLFQAKNRGKTPAQFISGNAEKCFVDSPENLPVPAIYLNECESPSNSLMIPTTEFDILFSGFDPDSFLDSGEKPTAGFGLYPPSGAVNPEAIREGRSLTDKMYNADDVLMFYGRIIYRDMLNTGDDSIHETRWCYAYFTNGRRFVTDGPKEYNGYT